MKLQMKKYSFLHSCFECGRKGEIMFKCSVCKKLHCYREIGREHPITCMRCFWKEIGYVSLITDEEQRQIDLEFYRSLWMMRNPNGLCIP